MLVKVVRPTHIYITTVRLNHINAKIYHREASLSEQYTDLLNCHCTKQDLSCTSIDKFSPEIARYRIRMPTARAATLSVATYAQEFITGRVCNSHIVSTPAIWIG